VTIWRRRLEAIAHGTAQLPAVVERLGLGRLTRWSEGYVEKTWEVEPAFCTGAGTEAQTLFGGYVAALADQVLAFAAMTVLDDNRSIRTADPRVLFFRPITTGSVTIRGRVLNVSASLIHVEAEFLQGNDDNTLVAKAFGVSASHRLGQALFVHHKLAFLYYGA
jgi:uncharacterized protein (TIGR00369 family)